LAVSYLTSGKSASEYSSEVRQNGVLKMEKLYAKKKKSIETEAETA
jgi:hypothetical protein